MNNIDVTESIDRFYVLRGRHGFYCDSEWDGDSFCSDPRLAYKKPEPWTGGRGHEAYQCIHIEVITYTAIYGHPDPSLMNQHFSKKGIRKLGYYVSCSNCGRSTKKYTDKNLAWQRWYELIGNSPCSTSTWNVIS